MKTIEKKTADTILQEPYIVEIGGKKYKAAPPTAATLIRVSEIVSEFPRLEATDQKQIIETVLANAWKCGSIGLIAATLIRGVTKTKKEENSLFNKLSNQMSVEEFGEVILTRKSNAEINKIVTELLSRLEVADFFALTTFLSELNIIRETKGVV